jgi:hypothetical protein
MSSLRQLAAQLGKDLAQVSYALLVLTVMCGTARAVDSDMPQGEFDSPGIPEISLGVAGGAVTLLVGSVLLMTARKRLAGGGSAPV